MGNNAIHALYTQRRKNTDNLYQASDFNSETFKTQASMRPGDHLHLNYLWSCPMASSPSNGPLEVIGSQKIRGPITLLCSKRLMFATL